MNKEVVMPNFYGIFEVKSLTKNRIRIEIEKLKKNSIVIEELKKNLNKISIIKNYKIIKSLGSLTVEFDGQQIDANFMIGIILKLLDLDTELLKNREGKLKKILLNFFKMTDIYLYNKTKGILDIKTTAGISLLIYGIKKFKTEPILPAGATLIWWATRLLEKKDSNNI